MSHNNFFENLAHQKPQLAIKYLAHLAAQIQGDGVGSARSQAIDARIEGDYGAVERACDREVALRNRFEMLSLPFFDEHVIVGTHGNDGQARDIFDIIHKKPLNRDYLMMPRESVQ